MRVIYGLAQAECHIPQSPMIKHMAPRNRMTDSTTHPMYTPSVSTVYMNALIAFIIERGYLLVR